MSKLITIVIPGDPEVFTKALAERAADFERISADGRMAGAVHHRFGVTDEAVLVVDEWDTLESFQAFFSRPELQTFISQVGGDMSAEPVITVAEAIDSSDQF